MTSSFAGLTTQSSPIADASLDHVEFHVEDITEAVSRFVEGYGFHVAVPVTRSSGGDHLFAMLRQGRIRFRVVQALTAEHPARAFTEVHGDGVASVALGVTDVPSVYSHLMIRGAVSAQEPTEDDGRTTAAVVAFGNVTHRLVERDEHVGSALRDVGFAGLKEVDHFAVCLPEGQLADCVHYYTDVFGMNVVFEENISVGPMGMNSGVVQNVSHSLTLTLIEPAPQAEAGQIEAFLIRHGGAGVQHIAFTSDDIVRSVRDMKAAGTAFLTTPTSYYALLAERLTPRIHSVDQLREGNILVDEDHDGQLFQIFTASEHPRNTLFFEVIERLGARTFGSNNIRALYEAVEHQRALEAAAR
ncbi:4-hydroxyphenylpyruvate dioxygenase [Streptomyces sp. NPDC018045]|uniref:4-hydroxyphenylpyruvate dioxygenase n=1 Tax=Streptomyces sp. NPDC018045 TaxID=3365037 RepID=UPI0037A9F1B7